MPVNGGASKPIQPSSRRSRVVVFDIDDTLCKRESCEDLPYVRENHPECPLVKFRDKENTTYQNVFLPYLHILFNYLLKQSVRIVFFSSGDKERDIPLITELLSSFWGREKYEALKSKGQFEIFSSEHTRKNKWNDEKKWYSYAATEGTEGPNVKDLKVVIRNGETLLDAILVEYDYSYTSYDQEPCMLVLDLISWYLCEDTSTWFKNKNFAKNSVYYMLGLFKTYFENEKYTKLSLREFLIQILPKDMEYYSGWFEKHPFAHNMMDIGLSEVQKQIPNAVLYGVRDVNNAYYIQGKNY